MQHSQLALMDRAQVILEITEGEGPHSQGNGRIKWRKKSILSRVETLSEHDDKRGCHIPWNGAPRKKANPTVGCHNLKAPFQTDTTLGTTWR